jgi:succinoglycan biosynthesis transport protein ExoP
MNHPEPNPIVAIPQRDHPQKALAHGSRPLPSALSSPPDAMGLIKALRRRWLLAILAGLTLSATCGIAAWYLTPPPSYTSSATLRVAMNPKRIMWNPQDNEGKPEAFQKTQLALITDRLILAHALAKPEVAKLATIQEQIRKQADPEEWLKERLNAKFSGESEILEVSLSGPRAEDLKTIVNAVVQSYMTLIVDAERKERLVRLEQLKTLWERYQKDLKLKRKSLQELADSVGTNDHTALALAQQFKVAQMSTARSEQARVNSELIKTQMELKLLENGSEDGSNPETVVSDAAISSQVEQHPEVSRLKVDVEQILQKYREYDRLVRIKSDPALSALRKRHADVRSSLDGLRSKLREDYRQSLSSAGPAGNVADRANDLNKLKASLSVWQGYKETLGAELENLQKEIRDLSRGGMDVEADREEIAIATEFARKVGSEVEYVQVELNAPDRVEVLAAAKTPRTKDEMRKIKAGGGGALGSFVLVLLGVSFWEFRARRVDTADDVTNGLGLKLVGILPSVSAKVGRRGVQDATPQRRLRSGLLESIDAARTMLLHASRTESIRVVMVTSAVPGEGKTSVACHLATSLARAGRKTLLIDGDLRRPDIHKLVSVPLAPGLCELLRGEVEIDEVVLETSASHLEVIPAGCCDGLALRALASQDLLKSILGGLKDDYDFIIVDSAPVLPVTDTLLIGQDVDAVVFSVLRNVSRLPEVFTARERLTGLGVKVLGAVVNGIQGDDYKSKYYNITPTEVGA